MEDQEEQAAIAKMARFITKPPTEEEKASIQFLIERAAENEKKINVKAGIKKFLEKYKKQ